MGNEQIRTQPRFFQSETLTSNSFRSLHYASGNQGCQLPDFNLRSQTFCYTADFSTTFLYMLKTMTFCTSYHKTTSKHPRIQEFWLYFEKKFRVSKQKREKCPHLAGSSCAWAGLWLAITRTLSTSRSFQTFLIHNVGNPGGNESIIYFTDLCKPIETYIYARKMHPFASYPTAKHPNATNLRSQTYDKDQRTFVITPHGL